MIPRYVCGCRCHPRSPYSDPCEVCHPGHQLHRSHERDYRLIKNHRAGA